MKRSASIVDWAETMAHFQQSDKVGEGPWRTRDFDFELPNELIAQFPNEPRDRSRLLVLRVGARNWEHRIFADLPDLLQPGDLLVRNNSKVLPARLLGHREATGGRWEGLFLRVLGDGSWEILATTRGRPQVGERVRVGEGLMLTLEGRGESGRWLVRPESPEPAFQLLERHGTIPLPPYIRKGQADPADRQTYQTTFARVLGSVAAPTAGLHFTAEVFERLADRGIGLQDLTLHVGLGTFRPIETESIADHPLHSEWAELDEPAADALNAARGHGGRIIAVGTTSARTLETAVGLDGTFRPFRGETALYLRPGHDFRGLDALLTNFHLPRSSLLVLVAAFGGYELVRAAYDEAIRQRYRFYSYGDAMLILP